MIGDPVSAMQQVVQDFLASDSPGQVVLDGSIKSSVLWRPHVYQVSKRTGWQLYSVVPDSDSWEKRIEKACAVDKHLTVGIAATEDTLIDPDFLLACYRLSAELILLKPRKDGFSVEASFASVADYVCEQRVKLDPDVARKVLDLALERALKAKTKSAKGVALEVVVALFLSQVDNFEVASIGISNRSQQMDVLVHNRSVGGVLGSSPLVIAEAKNWKNKVTPTEHASFMRKLESRNGRAKLGFLVTTGKFTAGIALEARRDSKGDIVVVFVDGASLPKIWRGKLSITQEVERMVIDASVGS